jgi:hypothetical protein
MVSIDALKLFRMLSLTNWLALRRESFAYLSTVPGVR